MSSHISACCAIVLNQQQQNIHYCEESIEDAAANCKTRSKNCTVVEDGRVVVRAAQIPVNKAE